MGGWADTADWWSWLVSNLFSLLSISTAPDTLGPSVSSAPGAMELLLEALAGRCHRGRWHLEEALTA